MSKIQLGTKIVNQLLLKQGFRITVPIKNDALSTVNAMGSKMDAATYSNGDGHAVFTAVVWADVAPKSVTWKKEDAALSAVSNKVGSFFD